MTRRSIFLLAATIVVFYFTIILFMLSPLHGSKGSYNGHAHMKRFGFRSIPTVNWCKDLHWYTPPTPNVVALFSFPGSGNTWLRYLLQQATGIVTGSVYLDEGLRMHGFPAEDVNNGSVLVVKTHETLLDSNMYKAALILIRHPRDAILADFNRQIKGHVGTAPKAAFKSLDWNNHVLSHIKYYETAHKVWLRSFQGPMHIVKYETLVRHTRDTLQGILDFLNQTISEADMNCVLAHKEGIYRRRNKVQFNPFTSRMDKYIEDARKRVMAIVEELQTRNNSTFRIQDNYTNN